MTKRKCDSTEEDQMKRILICKFCNETLEEPIILPCFKTICSKHLLNETNNFKCNLCDNHHDKTVDKFPVNEIVNELLQICDDYVNLNSIDLGQEYKLAKQQCKHLKDLINKSELLIKDPAFYINDNFNKLRNEIDLAKEELIESIERKYEKIINELNEIETKCKQNAQNKESKSKLEKTIESTKELLNEWTKTLESNLNRGDFCKNISNKSIQSISELKYEINKCKVALLDNKQYKFNLISTKDSSFGDLVTNDPELIDESRLEGAMRFEIKDFTKFRYSFNKLLYIDQWFVVNKIPWSVGVEMREIDKDIYLELLYRPLLGIEFLESNPFNTNISLKMMKTNGGSYGQKFYSGKFDDECFHVLDKFISLKDIMNPTNSLFNEKTDSVTIEANIKIID